MFRHSYVAFLLLLLLIFLSSCSEGPVDFTVTINATLGGEHVAGATVIVDGVEVGKTDVGGMLNVPLQRLREVPAEVTVNLDTENWKARSWHGSIAVPKLEQRDNPSYTLNAVLGNYITIVALSNNEPIADARITINKEKVGNTNAQGEFEYEFDKWDPNGFVARVSKKGYNSDKLTILGKSGQRFSINLLQRAIIQFQALSLQAGNEVPIQDANVYKGKTLIGKTGKNGYFTYRHNGKHGGKARFRLVAPNHSPSQWQTTVALAGQHTYKHYFYPDRAPPIRTGVYNFVANTSGKDIRDILQKAKSKMDAELFSEVKVFEQVPTKHLTKLIKNSKRSLETLTKKGWEKNRLYESLDLLVLGSIGYDENEGYIIEVKLHDYRGVRVMSQIVTASSQRRINSAIEDIVQEIVNRYPFQGMVTQLTPDGPVINLGNDLYPLNRDDTFKVFSTTKNRSGKIIKRRQIDELGLESRRAETSTLKKSNKNIKVGDLVVRRDSELNKTKEKLNIIVLGGVGENTQPLANVNVYSNHIWAGSTNRHGRLSVSAKLNRDVNLVMYRHGYKQIIKQVEFETNGQTERFVMQSYNSKLKIESSPKNATVSLDETDIGKTPILSPHDVSLGFHTLRLNHGGDYRIWEEVIDFNKTEQNFTGRNKIKLHKDYLKIAARAEKRGDIKSAMQSYLKTNKHHPDYAEARHQLAQLYLSEQQDFDAAIKQFELVRDIPEIKHLTLKQYAIVYTNLGQAYYEKGDSLVDNNKKLAAKYFAKAIKSLGTARENMRFFPNDIYEEALHDTYYYTAAAYHSLYMITKQPAVLNKANLAWQEYFDFFPEKLDGIDVYMNFKDIARRLWDRLKHERSDV